MLINKNKNTEKKQELENSLDSFLNRLKFSEKRIQLLANSQKNPDDQFLKCITITNQKESTYKNSNVEDPSDLTIRIDKKNQKKSKKFTNVDKHLCVEDEKTELTFCEEHNQTVDLQVRIFHIKHGKMKDLNQSKFSSQKAQIKLADRSGSSILNSPTMIDLS